MGNALFDPVLGFEQGQGLMSRKIQGVAAHQIASIQGLDLRQGYAVNLESQAQQTIRAGQFDADQSFGRVAALRQGNLLSSILVADVTTLIEMLPDLSQPVEQSLEIGLALLFAQTLLSGAPYDQRSVCVGFIMVCDREGASHATVRDKRLPGWKTAHRPVIQGVAFQLYLADAAENSLHCVVSFPGTH